MVGVVGGHGRGCAGVGRPARRQRQLVTVLLQRVVNEAGAGHRLGHILLPMRHSSTRSADSGRAARAREWERTARVALFVAVGVGVLAAVSRWDAGDLVVGIYFAATSLLLWAQSSRIRLARSAAPFTRTVGVTLAVAFCVGALLGAVDVATGGAI